MMFPQTTADHSAAAIAMALKGPFDEAVKRATRATIIGEPTIECVVSPFDQPGAVIVNIRFKMVPVQR